MDHLSENNDTRKIENEKIFLMRKIDEVKHEIFQRKQHSIFTNTRNAKKENSIV
jgi:hypothetical protein